ncbi:DUF4625 domain-containing protein [Pontibacter anaerobius]|uniref:DUF4625 domain-containing protein n=1 Tax=Pontibacter anaerobius TaxID=2993940 RepID=A0ABT3RDP4_9BACT|nr:DUF4625 domain-containing protein [Pontibacter anaerobius]MCX2739390.1 DUF4625 domain-containing protein [Pontibacter anaerobius]
MKKLNWLFLMFLSFAFVACDDDDDEVDLDVTAPTITISSPTDNAVYAAGDVVEFRANVTDNEGLENIKVWVTNPGGTTSEIEDDDINDFLNDNRQKNLELDVTLPADAPVGAYVMTVEATDEQGNNAEESVTITVE